MARALYPEADDSLLEYLEVRHVMISYVSDVNYAGA